MALIMMKIVSVIAAMWFTFGSSHAATEVPEHSPFTVVTFGDSTTAIRGGATNYTSQLEERLPSVRFVNRGVGGNTTEMGRRRFDAQVLAEKANLVVIQFGINDAAVDVWKTPPATESRVTLARYEENLRHFIDKIRNGGGEVILMTPNQMRWGPKLIVEKYGKPPYHPDDELGFTHILAGYAEVVRKIAAEQKVTLVDVYSLYGEWERSSSESCKKLMSDGMHPNTAGHRLVADALEPLIRAKAEK